MHIEKNQDVIQQAAAEKSDENWEFYSFLKGSPMNSSRIDSIVSKIYNDVTAQIDCTECANCCIVSWPVLDNEDIKNFVTGINADEEEFMAEYMVEEENDEDENQIWKFKDQPCPFLKDNLCTNYENRPKDCSSFPHLHKPGFTQRLRSVIDNYSYCPIVFNVYEHLKIKLWR
jgi:uncharacterized protein